MLQSVTMPGSLREAHEFLASRNNAKLIAGGTVVMPTLNYGTDDFTTLVSLRGAGLAGISVEAGRATIGAATTLSTLEDEPELDFLHPALDAIASPTIRNMATVAGNLFVKQPYGDLAVCLIALGATVSISGPGGIRIEPVETTVVTGVKPGEIVTQISFSLPAKGSFKFTKAARKAFNSASIVVVASVVSVTDRVVTDCRIALGGVARTPIRATSAEKALAGQPFDRIHVERAANAALNDIDPADDAYASAWYRRRVTPVHIRRALLGL